MSISTSGLLACCDELCDNHILWFQDQLSDLSHIKILNKADPTIWV